MIIDAHAHIFPDKIAVKVSHSISDFYEFPYRVPASTADLLAGGAAAGIDRYLVCSVATVPQQTEHINDFLISMAAQYPQFTALCALHPDYADYEAELDRAVAGGLHGVKLHPDFQHFYIDDEAYTPFFCAIARRGLPILMHMGDARYEFSQSARLVNLLRRVPDLVVTAAHFGGYSAWDKSTLLPKSENVYFDTSSSLAFLKKEDALRLIEHFGVDRFLFGTDFPIWEPKEEIGRFLALGLSESENQAIFAENFCRLYGI